MLSIIIYSIYGMLRKDRCLPFRVVFGPQIHKERGQESLGPVDLKCRHSVHVLARSVSSSDCDPTTSWLDQISARGNARKLDGDSMANCREDWWSEFSVVFLMFFLGFWVDICIDIHHTKERKRERERWKKDGIIGPSPCNPTGRPTDSHGSPHSHPCCFLLELFHVFSGDSHLEKEVIGKKQRITKPHGGLVSCAKASKIFLSPPLFGRASARPPNRGWLAFSSVPDWRIFDKR